LIVWGIFLPIVWWMGASLACAIQPGENIFEILDRLSQILRQPFSLHYTVYTGKCILILSFAYITGICIYYSQQKNYRRGVEHGSARWGDVHQICKRYADKEYTHNLLLTQNFRMSQEVYKHQRNLNVLVAGGSGAGKSRTYAVPNILQCSQAESKKGGGCSIVVTDPKGELLRKTGGLLERMGYEVRVFDLINPDTSFCYNPFCYVHDDKDVLKLINNLIRNTTPKGSQASDPFWEKSETALLQALMLYLLHEAPPEEQNFPMIMEMLGSAQVKEEDEEYQSPLDILFERLEMRKPDSIAVKQYQIYKQAAGKTAKSILISVGVRLAAFNLKEIANLTCTDELDLASIGEKKVALFCCIPDADTSLNYLVGMIYSNLFQTLYYVADRKYGGRLPVPVHCIMDEWPNVALPDDFDKILATMRSRAISCSIIIQNMAQMKALFKDSWESLVGNCDEFLYLGGNEKEGHKYISELLGKETLDTNTYGQTKGRNGSYSTNYQQTGRELFTPDEIRLLDNRKAILFVRGERPMLDDKYNLKKHPNVKWTEDGGAPPYDYAKAPRSHDDLNIDIERLDDYELLCEEDILGKEQPF
jgi:type IV secretion system protein VirD4